MAFLQPNFNTVCYVSVLMMLQSQDAICIHICTWPNVKSVYQIFQIWMYTCFGTFPYFNDVWLLPVLHLFQIQNCPLFLVWNICVGRSLNKLNTYCIFHIYLYILLILACVFGGCSLWWGEVVIPVDTQRVHHFSIAGLGGMMNHVYLQELQSGPSSVASSTHSMLKWVMILLYNHNKGLHITKLPFIPCHFHPLFCQVSF